MKTRLVLIYGFSLESFDQFLLQRLNPQSTGPHAEHGWFTYGRTQSMKHALRTLAGAPDASQHLAELALGPADLALAPLEPESAGENFLLLFALPGAPAIGRMLGQEWLLPPESLLWQHLSAPIHLRSGLSRPATVLAWRFTAAALPAELADLMLSHSPVPGPLVGPRPISPAEAALVLGLRSCPVAPALRSFWAAAKLLELVTRLLPHESPVSSLSPDKTTEQISLPTAVRAALSCMEHRLAEPIGLPELAAAAGQSPAHFSRTFTQAIGHGPTSHLRRLRMERAALLLSDGRANVTEAALAVGYQSLGQFSRVFTEHHGRPPSAFLARKTGQIIRKGG